MATKITQDSDQQLVERVQRGDKRAFDLLVVKYQHKIFSVVRRYIRENADAQDVVQEAFVKAYRALESFRGDSAFYTWMYRIAINTAKNHLILRGRRPPDTDVDIDDAEHFSSNEWLRDTNSPESSLFCDQLQTAVVQTISELPEELRTAITLREIEGLSYEEIADVMECPVGTVRSRIFRAREAIDKVVKPLMT